MNTYPHLPLTQIWQSLNNPFIFWQVSPARQTFTYQDLIGDPDDDIASYNASNLPVPDPLPEIAPDEFESDYCWFLS
jgi:hypothetical protein